jgi:mannose/fructose-specific phosphotransferase system component IIA
MVVPVIIGAAGTVAKGFQKSLEAIAGKQSIESIQTTTVLGTSH